MTMPMIDAALSLTEKEKQTLRLMVRGHDAKSIARALGLSVHTINERLRDARRKMAVSSSREAARLLLAAEGGDAVLAASGPYPENHGAEEIGEDAAGAVTDGEGAPVDGAGRVGERADRRFPMPTPFIIGGLCMTFVLGLLALAALPDAAPLPSSTPVAAQEAATGEINAEVVDKARAFLTLLDESRWADAYQETGSAFRKLNSLALWTQVSEKVRAPLGMAQSRTLLSQQNLPAPPDGYEVVKFRTRFASSSANGGETVETVTLERQGDQWRVVAVLVG